MSDEIEKSEWEDTQQWERSWWLNNQDLHPAEEAKGDFMARVLQIHTMQEKRVLDVGCGPLSLLLRNPVKEGVALDPLDFGPDLEAEYRERGIRRIIGRGEDLAETGYDEVWIYNCLQHCEDPELVLRNAIRASISIVRLFEWIDIPPYQGHLHTITADMLRRVFEEEGMNPLLFATGVVAIPDPGLYGPFAATIQTKAGGP